MDDLARLREEYKDRERRFAGSDVYSWLNPASLFAIHSRQRAVLSALKRQGVLDLAGSRILEMGCGGGGVLTEVLSFGAAPQNLFGIDLLADRLCRAQQQLPGCHFSNAEGQKLPFPSQSFDMVMQFTALSSILDTQVRIHVCEEMLRVLKPAGLLLWYDFWLNPTNQQTRGIRPREIRRLFPGCRYEFRRITLAPPLARRLISLSWGACQFLESLKIFNTHYLVIVSKP